MVKVTMRDEGPVVSPTHTYKRRKTRQTELLAEFLVWCMLCVMALVILVHSPVFHSQPAKILAAEQHQQLRFNDGTTGHAFAKSTKEDEKSNAVLHTGTSADLGARDTRQEEEETKRNETLQSTTYGLHVGKQPTVSS